MAARSGALQSPTATRRPAAAALRAADPSIGQATEDGCVPAADAIATAPYYANCTWVDGTKLTLVAKDGVMPMLARVVLAVLV